MLSLTVMCQFFFFVIIKKVCEGIKGAVLLDVIQLIEDVSVQMGDIQAASNE